MTCETTQSTDARVRQPSAATTFDGGSRSLATCGARRSSVRKVAALTKECRTADPAERKRVASSCVKSMISSSASQPALRDPIFAFAEVEAPENKNASTAPTTGEPKKRAKVRYGAFLRPPGSESQADLLAPCFCCGTDVELRVARWICLPSAPKPWCPLCPNCGDVYERDRSK